MYQNVNILFFFFYLSLPFKKLVFNCYFIICRGSSEATKQAHTLITVLIKDPEVDILQMLPKSKLNVVTTSSWDKSVSTIAVSTRNQTVINFTCRII